MINYARTTAQTLHKKRFIFQLKKIMLLIKKFIFANHCLNHDNQFCSFGELLSNFSGLKLTTLPRDPMDSHFSSEYLIGSYYIQKQEVIGKGGSAKVYRAIRKDFYDEEFVALNFLLSKNF